MMEENSRKIDTKKLDSIIEACGGDNFTKSTGRIQISA